MLDSGTPLDRFFSAVYTNSLIAGMIIEKGQVICSELRRNGPLIDFALKVGLNQLKKLPDEQNAKIANTLAEHGVVPELVARGYKPDVVELMTRLSLQLRGKVMAAPQVAELLAAPVAPPARPQNESSSNTRQRDLVLAG